MATSMWAGAVGLTITGGLFFWGARIFEMDSFYLDASAILGLALVLVGLAQI